MSIKLPHPEFRLRFHWPVLVRDDLLFGVGAACLVAALLFVFAGPGLQEVRRARLENAVFSNAATVQLAAESFAAAHQGRYPDDARELVPWLPDDRPPVNPVSGRPVAFRPGVGEVTYRSPRGGPGYVIEGWGDVTQQPLIVLSGSAPDVHR